MGFPHIIENFTTFGYDIKVGISMRRLVVMLLAAAFLAPKSVDARMNYRRLLLDLPVSEAPERPLIIRALGNSRRKKSMRALLNRLNDLSLPVSERRALVEALGDLGYEKALFSLVAEWARLLERRFKLRTLPEEEEGLRASVVLAVGKVARSGDQEALGVLRRAVVDDERDVVLAAAVGLGRV
ncbi:MAG: hypothetical protein COB53_00005, partial [Elusimicrobia bacterium]